jgi:hypothetical protein
VLNDLGVTAGVNMGVTMSVTTSMKCGMMCDHTLRRPQVWMQLPCRLVEPRYKTNAKPTCMCPLDETKGGCFKPGQTMTAEYNNTA